MSGARRHQQAQFTQPGVTGYDANVLASGPVLYLPLSTHANDTSGNGHNATLAGSPSFTASAFLNGDGALTLNGTSQFASVADFAAKSVVNSPTGALTVEAWIKPAVLDFPTAEGTGPYCHWAGVIDYAGGGKCEWAFRMYDRTSYRPSRISFYHFNNTCGLGSGSYFEDPSTITTSTWVYVVGIVRIGNQGTGFETGDIRIFRDGTQRDRDALKDYSIVPTDETTGIYIGTGDGISSLFQGDVCKFAVYNYALSPAVIHARYQSIVPPVSGSARFLSRIGSTSVEASGNKVNIVVGPNGVAAGSTVIADVGAPWTSLAPTMADSKGNIYTRDRTSADSGNVMRGSRFSAPINVPLLPGDIIQAAFSASVANRTAIADEFTNLSFAAPQLDKSNSGQGTSTAPGINTATGTTSTADELVVGTTFVNGPNTDVYTEDALADFVERDRAGTNSGANDVTVNSGYKSVQAIGSFKHQPTLGTSRLWIEIISTYFAGTPNPTPPPEVSDPYVRRLGTSASTVAGSTSVITLTGEDVVAGHVVQVLSNSSFTGLSPTCTDSKGNTYVLDRTAPDSGNNLRGTAFGSILTTTLVAGDTITVSYGGSLAVRTAIADEFSSYADPVVINVQNGASGNSATPSVAAGPTTQAQTTALAVVFTAGPVTDAILDPDVIHLWTPLVRAGTSGSVPSTDDKTITPAYRAVATNGTTFTYAPTLETSQPWVAFVIAYNAV